MADLDRPRPKRRRKRRGRLWNVAEYVCFRVIEGVLGALPLRSSLALGAAGGSFYGALTRVLRMRDHRVATTNLRLAFPEKSAAERDRIRREMWRNWGRYAADAVHLRRMSPAQVRDLVFLGETERIVELSTRRRERGVLVLTGHFGSFEFLHAAVSSHGHPASLVNRPMANPLFDAWLLQLRTRFGTHQIERGKAARAILRDLSEGRMVAIPFDQAARKETRIFAPFFGIPASTNSGLARLVASARAPVYAAVIVREGSSTRHRVLVGPEIEVVRTDDRDADTMENSRRFNAALEDLIRAHPEQWIWMYRRWKQQPEGLVSPYLPDAPPDDVYRAAARQL